MAGRPRIHHQVPLGALDPEEVAREAQRLIESHLERLGAVGTTTSQGIATLAREVATYAVTGQWTRGEELSEAIATLTGALYGSPIDQSNPSLAREGVDGSALQRAIRAAIARDTIARGDSIQLRHIAAYVGVPPRVLASNALRWGIEPKGDTRQTPILSAGYTPEQAREILNRYNSLEEKSNSALTSNQ